MISALLRTTRVGVTYSLGSAVVAGVHYIRHQLAARPNLSAHLRRAVNHGVGSVCSVWLHCDAPAKVCRFADPDQPNLR